MVEVVGIERVLPVQPYASFENKYGLSGSGPSSAKIYFIRGDRFSHIVDSGEYHVFYVNLSESHTICGHFGDQAATVSFDAMPNQLIAVVPSKSTLNYAVVGGYHQAVLCLHQSLLNDRACQVSAGEFNSAEVAPCFVTDSPFLCSALREIEQAETGNSERDDLFLESLYSVVLAKVMSKYTTMKKDLHSFRMHSPSHMKKVLDFIFLNLDKDIKVASLASMMNLSPYHFTRVFKEYLGLSPYQYVLNLRFDKAKDLLINTDTSLVYIADSLGFSSQSHFQSFFKKQSGMTPKDYRRRVPEDERCNPKTQVKNG